MRRFAALACAFVSACSWSTGTAPGSVQPASPPPPVASPSPVGSLPLRGDIAFVSSRGGSLQLFAIPAAGGQAAQLTFGADQHYFPAWSPDGTRIAYIHSFGPAGTGDFDLHVLSDEGDEAVTRDAARDGSPAWSPDGSRLAFESALVGSPAIVTIDEDGSRTSRSFLTDGVEPAFQPAWSPDGTKIVFALRVAGCATASAVCEQHLWMMDTRGRHLVQLTSGLEHAGEPEWSPDGTRIAFTSNRGNDHTNFDIWTMAPDGSDTQRVTRAKELDFNPSWSPDGSQIVFTSRRDGDFEIYLMGADGRDQTNLTRDPGSDDVTPTWRPPIA